MIKFLPFFLVLLYSCSEVQSYSGPETTIPDTTTVKKEKKLVRKYYDFDYTDTVLTEFPGEETSQILVNYEFTTNLGAEMNVKDEPVFENIILKESNGQTLPLEFSNEQFLSKFFGHQIHYVYDMEETDSIPVSWWYCKNCIADTIPYFVFDEIGDIFPGAEMNTSFVSGDYHFLLGKMKCRLISFVSYSDEFAVSFCGRFSGGLMGCALFEETSVGSKLLDLNYKVGMFGNYNQPSEPEIRIAFDQLFLIYQCTNGGAGGPYTSINQIWQCDGNKLRKLTEEVFLTLNNTDVGSWETKYQFYQDSLSKKVGIKLITTGNFTGYCQGKVEEYEDYFYDEPRDFTMSIRDCDLTKRPFEFVLERTRIFENGKTIKTQKFDSKKLKGKWVEVWE